MSLLLQQLLVGALVSACVIFSAWRLSSMRLRLRALESLAAWPLLRRASWLARLHARTSAQQARACGGCAGAASHTAKPRSP